MTLEKEEFRRIGIYTERLAAGLRMTDGQRLELRELLKKWLAEVEAEPITMGVPSAWGDVRRL